MGRINLERLTNLPKSHPESILNQLSPPISLQDDFWPQLGSILNRFRLYLGHFLVNFSVLLWLLHVRSNSATIWADFSSIFDPWRAKNHWKINGFLTFLHLLHDRSWNLSWTDFGSILGSQIGLKLIPNRFWTASNFSVVSERPPGPSKNRFLRQHGPKLTPTWPPKRPQMGSREGFPRLGATDEPAKIAPEIDPRST